MPAHQVIRARRGTTLGWAVADPILAAGELGYVTDSGILKVGDGHTSWGALGGILMGAGPPLTFEDVDDRVANFIRAGTNITTVYDDNVSNTLTISAKTTAASKSVIIAPAAVASYTIWQAPKPVTILGVRGFRNGGTGATINARVNALDLLANDMSLATADTWQSSGIVQNTAMAAGASLSVAIRSLGGTPNYITFQVDYQDA